MESQHCAGCATLLAYVESQPPQLAPGTEPHYPNIGFCTLSELIAETSHTTYIDYMDTNIFTPRGMNDTAMGSMPEAGRQERESFYYGTFATGGPGSDPPPPSLFPPYGAVPRPYGNVGALDAPEGAGGLVSTATDLGAFRQRHRRRKTSVFNRNDNNVPAPQDPIFWPNCALQAAYNHTACKPGRPSTSFANFRRAVPDG